ncbi:MULTISPECIES: hypothetical protein [Corynebacterium]|uniref:hypothetical protein n=1 Tax=Corynebacterium TaxID=1716 RepID=UPI00117E777A|nr:MULTISPECIES: hypothetical protein [Corynebacterium]HJE09777.1 hypothetical protein [Corynebacterium glutamicum]
MMVWISCILFSPPFLFSTQPKLQGENKGFKSYPQIRSDPRPGVKSYPQEAEGRIEKFSEMRKGGGEMLRVLRIPGVALKKV